MMKSILTDGQCSVKRTAEEIKVVSVGSEEVSQHGGHRAQTFCFLVLLQHGREPFVVCRCEHSLHLTAPRKATRLIQAPAPVGVVLTTSVWAGKWWV